MMEKIDIKEVERNLPSGVPDKIRALDAGGNPIASTPADLLSVIENITGFRRIFMPKLDTSGWMRIIEVKNGNNCSFILNMVSFADRAVSIIAGSASSYASNVMYCEFKQLVGTAGAAYCPNIKYKMEKGIIIVWAIGTIVNSKSSCITLLHGNALFPMTIENPPEDAIQPIW